MRTKKLIGATAAVIGLLLPASTAAAAGGRAAAAPDPNRATVAVQNSPYGRILVVGGAGAGYVAATSTTPAHYLFPAGSSLYIPSIDPPTSAELPGQTPYQAGCGTTLVSGAARGPISCTGPETDRRADWPALTTDQPPVAGPGANPWLLGSVYRSDLGTYQVTYGGHPLYLFDPGPNSYFGANFYETVLPLPPWHTAWYLLSPAGLPASGPATIETEAPQTGTTYTTPKLAVEMLPNAVPGGVAVSAYSHGDPATSHCSTACQLVFVPVYTVGAPIVGAGVNATAVGTIRLPSGAHQVTYNGVPLYIYSEEQPLVGAHGPVTSGTAGNGDGVTFKTSTFNLVNP